MVAERRELSSLPKPPAGYFWSPEARQRRRENLDVYNSRAKGGDVPWQTSPNGPRPDADPTKYLPTLTPGVDKLPRRCIFCRSALLDKREPAGGEQRGMLSCTGCGKQLAWLRPRITAASRPLLASVTYRRPIVPSAPFTDSVPTVQAREAWRKPGCGEACRRERVIVVGGAGGRQGAQWREYHDADAHDGHLKSSVLALAITLSSLAQTKKIVRTGVLTVDLVAQRAVVLGNELRLSPTEFAILRYLASHLGQPCENDDVIASVWPAEVHARTGKPLVSGTDPHHKFRVHVVRMRQKMGEGKALIETRPGFGYMLRAEPPIGAES